jgi:hypothetical protein
LKPILGHRIFDKSTDNQYITKEDAFEWDDDKAAANWRAHGVTFHQAVKTISEGGAGPCKQIPSVARVRDRAYALGSIMWPTRSHLPVLSENYLVHTVPFEKVSCFRLGDTIAVRFQPVTRIVCPD